MLGQQFTNHESTDGVAILAVRDDGWTLLSRAHYALVVLGGVAFATVLWHWNPLDFQY